MPYVSPRNEKQNLGPSKSVSVHIRNTTEEDWSGRAAELQTTQSSERGFLLNRLGTEPSPINK
jgi:hypothetical protein